MGDWSGEWCFARMVFYNKGDSMKSLHAIWVYEVFNEVTEVGYLPGWTEEDCK